MTRTNLAHTILVASLIVVGAQGAYVAHASAAPMPTFGPVST